MELASLHLSPASRASVMLCLTENFKQRDIFTFIFIFRNNNASSTFGFFSHKSPSLFVKLFLYVIQFPHLSAYSVASQNFLVMNSDLMMVARSIFRYILGPSPNWQTSERCKKSDHPRLTPVTSPSSPSFLEVHFPEPSFLYGFLWSGSRRRLTFDLQVRRGRFSTIHQHLQADA